MSAIRLTCALTARKSGAASAPHGAWVYARRGWSHSTPTVAIATSSSQRCSSNRRVRGAPSALIASLLHPDEATARVPTNHLAAWEDAWYADSSRGTAD